VLAVRQRLRATTWLAPGLPMELFMTACAAIGDALDADVALRSERATSGPPPGETDPFATGACDIGFLCVPSYRRLAALDPTPIRLVDAAPVPADPRCEGRPVFFVELVVRAEIGCESLRDLDGRVIAGNDTESLSGSVALDEALAHLDGAVVPKRVYTGSHHASLAALAAGQIDAAVVDSNTLIAAGLPAGCVVAEVWGPFPVQPVVVAARLDGAVAAHAATALLAIDAPELVGTGFVGFAPPLPLLRSVGS
jgi:ABC-type phosphate/phosphonate transport system substrate-binding protein